MPIPFEIVSLIERLNQVNQMEQETITGANLALQLLNRYINNAILTQYYAYFETIHFFIITTRNQIHAIAETLSIENNSFEVIQGAGEDLGLLLGRVIEVKMNLNRTQSRLDNWL